MSPETFESLLTVHLQSITTFVRTRLKAADHADDIIQQTLLRAFVHRGQLREPSRFRSWLWSIALNEIRMFFRRNRVVLSLDEIPGREFPDRGPSALTRYEHLEKLEYLRAGMAKLSARDRTAIRLRDLDGLSLPETARALRRSESAAKSTHFRARQRLACALREIS